MTLGDQALTKAERKAFKKERKRIEQQQEKSQSLRSRLITSLAIAVVCLGIGLFFYNRYIPVPVAEKNKPLNQPASGEWIKGNPEAKVVLIEYSDFQCPACKTYTGLVDTLSENYPSQLLVVYRHFPLKTLHLQATLAAEAAEAAGKQGKFWEMHDLLFDNQSMWAEKGSVKNYFLGYAKELNLNLDQFEQDIKSKSVKAAVQADYESGIKERINATPTFYLNGERLQNPQGYEAFADLIETQLRLATGSAQIQPGN